MSHDITQNSLVSAEEKINLYADNNITMQDIVLHAKNQDVLHTTAGIAVKGKDGVLLLEAGKDIHLSGATLEALGDNGSLILKAGNNIHLDTETLEAKKDMTENSDNYIRTYRKTETTNTLAAGKNITLAAGENLSARNTTVLSENGQITVAAKGDVNLENGYNESRDDYGLKYKERGLLSSKTTTIKSHDESKTVTASTLSGDAVQITAGGNTNMTGSQVIGTHDVAISSGKDTSISSAQEYDLHDYAKQVKKSGLLSGGGLGFTIGTEKRKDQYSDADILQKSSTVGSISGKVTITSDKDIHVNASDIIAGKDISMTGENVNISSKDNIYHSEEKHEYKKSGLTVSVGGAGIEAIESVAAPATRMTEVSDHRLKALYGYETAEKIKKNGDALKAAAKGNFSPTVSIGITSSSSKSESHSTITEAQGSSLQAGQDMTIKTKEDLNVKGSDIVGNHIHLKADNDIHIWATEEKETQKSSQSSKGGSLGVSLSAGSVVSIDGKFYAGKGKENGSTTSYRASTVNANDTLTMKSGKDTDLIGSTVSGNKVKADVYGNLNIESLQTKKEYSEENISAGMSFSTAAGKTSYGGSASKGNMKSHYESVINQAGIRAGGEGFDISVKENTDLKGGVIDSAASKDKNTLTTGTLSWEDKENKADYKAGGMGVSYSPNDKSSKLNQRGLTPNLTPTVKDNADSTTKSAVAEGTIHITNKEKQKQDIASLNRDTKNSLNQLQEIFDKTKVEERQELVGMLEKYGNQAIHTYAESKGWKDGSTEKMLLHGAFGALMGDMAGGSAATGALSGSINEYVMGYLTKTKGEDWMQKHPDTVQWISMGVASTLGKLANGSVSEVADIALAGTKWNYYGSRKDEKGNISGMGKIAALLQPDGTYQYVTNVNGTDIPINREDLYKYTSVWIEDPENPGMGYTYIINGDDGDTYYSGTFKDERFDKQNRSMIYLGVDNWNEMESIIPGFSKTDKVGDKIFPELSKFDELKAYSWSKSLASNALSEKVNMVPNELVKQNWGGSLFKYFTKAGGIVGVPLTLNDMRDDWNNYSGYRLWQVWSYNGLPLIGGFVGGKPLGIIGAVVGAMAGDRAKDWAKDKIPTDQDIQLTKGSSKRK